MTGRWHDVAMQPPRLLVHYLQITFQRRIARESFDRLLNPPTPDAIAVHQEVQSMLAAAAAVSKALWPGSLPPNTPQERRHFSKLRGEMIRKQLQPSPLLQNRDVRNGIEHVDERLDSIFFDNPFANIADANVSSRDELSQSDLHYLRHLDPDTLVASVADAEVDLRDLMDALDDVADRAQGKIEERAW